MIVFGVAYCWLRSGFQEYTEFAKDMATFAELLKNLTDAARIQQGSVLTKTNGEALEVCRRAATTKLEFKVLKAYYVMRDVSEAQESISNAENKFNRYRKFARTTCVHKAVLRLRDEIMNKKVAPKSA